MPRPYHSHPDVACVDVLPYSDLPVEAPLLIESMWPEGERSNALPQLAKCTPSVPWAELATCDDCGHMSSEESYVRLTGF